MPSQNGSPPVRRIGDLESQRDDGGERSRILPDVLQAASHLQLYVQICSAPREHGEWLTATALVKPDVDPLASLLQRLNSTGSGFNRRAAAASLMLRYGWAAGFAITSYLVQSRVPFLR